MLRRLHVVLFAVGPVEVDLLAVVGDDVGMFPGVAPLRDEVAVLVIPPEERVEVVVDVPTDVGGGFRVAGTLAPEGVLLAERGLLVLHELSARGDGLRPEELDHLVASLLELARSLRFRGDRPLSHGLLDRAGEVLVDVPVHDLPPCGS